MKKFIILAVTIIMAFSLAACGRNRNNNATTPTTETTATMPTVLDPTILDPTSETNIPDPSVDTHMTSPTDHTTNSK